MNFTIPILKNVTSAICNSGCVTLERCKEKCLVATMEMRYEFVWFFIVAFIFYELSSVILFSKIELDIKIKSKIAGGLKISSYVLNLMGILYYLFMIR